MTQPSATIETADTERSPVLPESEYVFYAGALKEFEAEAKSRGADRLVAFIERDASASLPVEVRFSAYTPLRSYVARGLGRDLIEASRDALTRFRSSLCR